MYFNEVWTEYMNTVYRFSPPTVFYWMIWIIHTILIFLGQLKRHIILHVLLPILIKIFKIFRCSFCSFFYRNTYYNRQFWIVSIDICLFFIDRIVILINNIDCSSVWFNFDFASVVWNWLSRKIHLFIECIFHIGVRFEFPYKTYFNEISILRLCSIFDLKVNQHGKLSLALKLY